MQNHGQVVFKRNSWSGSNTRSPYSKTHGCASCAKETSSRRTTQRLPRSQFRKSKEKSFVNKHVLLFFLLGAFVVQRHRHSEDGLASQVQ